MKNNKVGLVTVLYNAPEVLEDFFFSISSQEFKNYHLYIIDNSTTPEPLRTTKKLIHQYSLEHVTLIDNKSNNVGVAAGNNQGIKSALKDGCDYILLINNDLIFKNPCVLSTLMHITIEKNEKMVSPLILNYPEKKIWYAGGYFDEYRALAPHKYVNKNPKTIKENFPIYHEYAPTCFLIIHRSVFEKSGLIDESYFAYYDDTDFLYRAHKNGFTVRLIPDVKIYHKVSISTGGNTSFFGAYYLTRNRLFFAKKCLKFPKREISLAYTIITRIIIIMFSKSKTDIKKALIKGILDGIRM
ncbi:glycosyltransferase family 2 protein [Xenorhabdus lircayensis]|uniref:Glycosyltransferase family 2 protein n=1 Tax=Xenorhabdus lircayensis TaxID=2763499 RepID=A0ABS0U2B5_9GAMM|nr:glycosyltransferase family 2 protein [Xenorhabdus lircayensis]MBI6548021.1 glycosyltransferase family 2 protein [Xenorhabdus lircayensis]